MAEKLRSVIAVIGVNIGKNLVSRTRWHSWVSSYQRESFHERRGLSCTPSNWPIGTARLSHAGHKAGADDAALAPVALTLHHAGRRAAGRAGAGHRMRQRHHLEALARLVGPTGQVTGSTCRGP